jgi:hypothetical protein
MKIIVKPLGAALVGGLVVAGIAIPQFRPQTNVYQKVPVTTATANPAPNLTSAANWLPFETAGGVHWSQVLKEMPPGCNEAGGVHLEAVKVGKDPWSVGYNQVIAAEFAKNEQLTLTFWARSKETQQIRIAMQHPKNKYHECWNKEQTLVRPLSRFRQARRLAGWSWRGLP